MENFNDVQKYLASMQEANAANSLITQQAQQLYENQMGSKLKEFMQGEQRESMGETLLGLGSEMIIQKGVPKLYNYVSDKLAGVLNNKPAQTTEEPDVEGETEPLFETSNGIEMQNFSNMPLMSNSGESSIIADVGGEDLLALGQNIGEAFGEAATNALSSLADGVVSSAMDIGQNIVGSASGILSNALSSTAESVSNAVSNASSMIASTTDTITSTADTIASGVAEAAGGAVADVAAGASIGEALGPIGMIGGALIGGLISFFTGHHEENEGEIAPSIPIQTAFLNPSAQFL